MYCGCIWRTRKGAWKNRELDCCCRVWKRWENFGDRVYVYTLSDDGEITNYDEESGLYTVELDTGKVVEVEEGDFEVGRDGGLPMWGTMWSFGESIDDWWVERGGLKAMANCGFRVYEQEDFGYIFGIDGAGYNFYESHWIPLYKAQRVR